MLLEQAISELHTLPRMGEPTLERMQALLARLGNPERQLKFIHIAGTNGKGTVASLTANILHEAGYKTGLTISPYVLEFRERFQINGTMILKRVLSKLIVRVMETIRQMTQEGCPTPVEFEAVTAVALLWFAQEQCDLVVMETGLGGRFDATNAAVDAENLLVSAITKIGLDHTEILGDTLEKIAGEKAGILKEGRPVVCYPEQPKEALVALLEAANQKHCGWIYPDLEDLRILKARPMENYIDYGGYRAILRYPGRHQALNATMAIEIALTLWREYGYNITDQAILTGLACSSLPARIEWIGKHPRFILDGCHNPDGAAALAEALVRSDFDEERLVAVVGMMADKNVDDFFSALEGRFSKVFTATPDNPRAMTAADLAEVAKYHFDVQPCDNLEEAVRLACAEDSDGVVVCGSLYLAAQARPLLRKLSK